MSVWSRFQFQGENVVREYGVAATFEQFTQFHEDMRDWETHVQLQNDLVEHMWAHVGNQYMYFLLFVCKTMWNIFICIWLVKLYYLFGRLNYFACYFISQYVWMQINVKLGGQPATPAHMGRRVGRAADPYEKQSGRGEGGRPKRTKSGRKRRLFGSARWSCS